MITPEQTDAIKKQLIQHIETSFPEDKKEFAKQKILSMDPSEIEMFLKQNNLVQTNQKGSSLEASQCVFCSIASEHLQSYKIAENPEAIAVLEINPLSRGHTIIIPRQHITAKDKLSKGIFSLAKEVSRTLKSKLKAININTNPSNVMGHEIINVIPIYDGEDYSEEIKKPAKPENLADLQNILKNEKAKKNIRLPKKTKIKQGEKIWLPKKIP